MIFSRRLFAALLVIAAGLLAMSSQPANATPAPVLEAVELPVGNSHAQPFDRMVYLLGDDGQLDPEAALARRDEFQPVTSPWIDFGDQNRPIWLLMRVRNPGERSGEWMLDIQRTFADELLVAKLDNGEVSQTLLQIDGATPFAQRPIVSQYLVAPLALDGGETTEILIGMRSSTGSWMPVTFATPERMRTAHMQEARFNWTINGAILALVIAALLVGRLVGWPLALGFAGYAGLGALFVANHEGYLHRFVFTEGMSSYPLINLVLMSGAMAALLLFAKSFSELPQSHPRFAKIVAGVQIALIGLAGASFVFWQSEAFGLLVTAFVPVVALMYLAMAVIAWRKKVLGAVPFLIGSAIVALTVMVMAAMIARPGELPLTVALDYFHTALLFESLAFFVAIMVRMLAIQRDLNRSLQAEVSATREKLKLAEALQESRSRYDAARGAADTMRARLQSTSHDLQQPMIALRQNLQQVADRDSEAAGKLESALDYLEAVTASGLAEETAHDGDLAGEKPDEGAESFPVSVVLENCATMFRGEAERAGVHIAFAGGDAKVHVDPVLMMRAVSNLVSNAVKHAGASEIVLEAAESGGRIAVRVIDNGKGLTEAEIVAFGEANAKGEDSDGHGLGLALVRSFAEAAGGELVIRSKPGEGSTFEMLVPKGA